MDTADTLMERCDDTPDPVRCSAEYLGQAGNQAPGCALRVVMFTIPGCPACAETKTVYADLLAQGSVQEIDGESPDGDALMDRLGLDKAPTLAILDCQDNLLVRFDNPADG